MIEYAKLIQAITAQFLDGAITEAEMVNAIAGATHRALASDWYKNSPVQD